jgi:hypothetical protein
LSFSEQQQEKRQNINYFDLFDPNKKEHGLIVPCGTVASQVLNASECRYGGRFPTLTYVHSKTGNQLWRSSELRQKMMDSESIKDDIAIIDLLAQQTGQLIVYSARENQTLS